MAIEHMDPDVVARSPYLLGVLSLEDFERRRKSGVLPAPFELVDGTLGYRQHRGDDCLQVAIATLLQVPSREVPDLRLDEQWASGKDVEEITREAWRTLVRWADGRGLTIMIHPQPPRRTRRWIGVVAQNGIFNDHSLVMTKGEILHDPMSCTPNHSRYDHADIDWGITIRKE